MGRSEKDIRALCPAAALLSGLSVIGHKVHEAEARLRNRRGISSRDAGRQSVADTALW